MERKYYKSKWKYEDLDDKRVQFILRAATFWVKGIGIFRIHVNGELISVDIVVSHVVSRAEGYDNIYHLFQAALADRIETHPDKSVADFRLLA